MGAFSFSRAEPRSRSLTLLGSRAPSTLRKRFLRPSRARLNRKYHKKKMLRFRRYISKEVVPKNRGPTLSSKNCVLRKGISMGVLKECPLSCTSVTPHAKFERRSRKMGEVQRRLFWEPFLLPPSLPAIQHFCSALEAISRKPRDHSCMLTLCAQPIEQDGKHQMKPSMISASLDSLDSLAFLLALEAVMSQKRKPNSKGGRKPSD